MSTYLKVESASTEILSVPITSRLDPTGAPPEFELTAITETDPAGSWAAGTWAADPYDSVTGEVTALTPTVGAAGTLATVEGTPYKLWIKWVHGGETLIREAAVLNAI